MRLFLPVPLLFAWLAAPVAVSAQDRIVVLDDAPSSRADALRLELAGQPVTVEVVSPGASPNDTALAQLRAGAAAVVWREGDPPRVRVLRSEVREAPLSSDDDRAFAIVAGSLLREGPAPAAIPAAPSSSPPPAAPVRAAVDAPARPPTSPTPPAPTSHGIDPLYLAIGARVAYGPVLTTHPSGAGNLEVEGRVGVSFGDYGIALVGRVGGAALGTNIDDANPGAFPGSGKVVSGVFFAASGYLALLGTSRSRGFFSRGAYFALGAALIFDKPGPAVAFSHPLAWLGDSAYLAADVTGQWQMFGMCAATGPNCSYQYFHLQFGLSVVYDG